MDIIYSKMFKKLATNIRKYFQGQRVNNQDGHQLVNLPLQNYTPPADGKILLVAKPEDARIFGDSINNKTLDKPLTLVDVWDKKRLDEEKLDFYPKNPMLSRGSVISNTSLNTTGQNAGAIIPQIGDHAVQIFENYSTGKPVSNQIYYLSANPPGLNEGWYKNLLLTYMPNLSYMRELAINLDSMKQSGEAINTTYTKEIKPLLKSLNETLANDIGADLNNQLMEINNDLTQLTENIKSLNINTIFNFSGIPGLADTYLDTVTEFFSKFCATTDAVASRTFLWKKGKASLRKFKRKYFVGTNGYREMKKIYTDVYNRQKKDFKGNHPLMQSAMSHRITEYYMMMVYLKEIVFLQKDLILNLNISKISLNAILANFNTLNGIPHRINNVIGKFTGKAMLFNATKEADFQTNKINITDQLGRLLMEIGGVGKFVEWHNQHGNELKDIQNDLTNLAGNINDRLINLQDDQLYTNLLNNFVNIVTLGQLAGGTTIATKELRKLTMRFTDVWMQQMRDIIRSVSKKEKQGKGFMQAWNLVVGFAHAHSKRVRRERLIRVGLLVALGLFLGIAALGIDWGDFWTELKSSESFTDVLSTIWSHLKTIPEKLKGLFS